MNLFFRKKLYIILFLLFLPLPLLGLDNDSGYIPLLKKRVSGNYAVTGRVKGVKRPARRRKKFNFDRPSGRGFSKEPLSRPLLGSIPPVSGTWRVAVIRVGFKTDRDDDLSSIETGGEFMLQPDSTVIIDPPPHNKAYFNSHMEGLKNYYHFQSGGRLDITWEIFPVEEDSSYKLTDIADYGPGYYGGWTTEKLVEFLRDALTVTEADNDIDFTEFDAIVLAHAGADLQSDVNNDSPNDIPSFFARLGEDDYITVEGGAKVITDCSVIPETGLQDDYYGGIAAVLAHEFGHQLGLPDLYNTYTGSPSVGVWDNMDSGGQMNAVIADPSNGEIYVVSGVIPGGLSAWSRYYMGWIDEVDTLEAFNSSIDLRAVEKSPSEIIRVDISNDEYYLIENRCCEINGEMTYFVPDTLTSVIVGLGHIINGDSLKLTNEYDVLLPTASDTISTETGPGLLIWHIDERLIAERWNENIINTGDIFGVRLMEANEFFDLGDPTSWYGLGWYDDAYYEGNNSFFSDPFAWSNLNVASGVSVENISGRDTLMTFGAGVRALRTSITIAADTALSEMGIVTLEKPRDVLVVDVLGRGWLADSPAPVFSLGEAPVTPVAFADSFSLGESAVVIADKTGVINAFSTLSWNQFSGWPVETEGISTHPVVLKKDEGVYIAVADTTGRVLIFDSTGNLSRSRQLSGRAGNIANMAVCEDQNHYADKLIYLSGDLSGAADVNLNWWDFELDSVDSLSLPLRAEETAGDAVLLAGDILPDRSGIEVYVVIMSRGQIILCSKEGIVSSREIGKGIESLPLIIDINGDSSLDLVCTEGEVIYASGPSGADLTGWPRNINEMHITTFREHIASPLSAASTGDESYIIAVTENGLLYTLDHKGEFAGGGYPERIAASITQPVELTAGEDNEGLITYIDLLENGDGTYYSRRPEETAVESREGPFSSEDISLSWSAVFGNRRRTSFAVSGERWSEPAEDWENMANLIIYPNPSSGKLVGFHFSAPSGAEARLQVFNILGEIILEKTKICIGGEEHGFSVTGMSDKAAGVYIGRVVIKSEGKSAEIIDKFAIVK
ncbi:MAG: immune inhibitor A [Candidatus Krumholzibacteriota bacterium]|nr:immune inhibitor A [Candidatus Krumholzibacteriota bacterium]